MKKRLMKKKKQKNTGKLIRVFRSSKESERGLDRYSEQRD